MVSYNPSKRIRHFSVCLTAAAAVTDGVSTYSACGNLVDQVILPTRALFRAVRPQIPSCNALQVLRTALERTYLRRRGGNRCSFARNEIIHKSIFLKYIHEYYAFIYLLMYLYPSGTSRFAYKARKFDSEWRNNSF